jgi:hypothetical protein
MDKRQYEREQDGAENVQEIETARETPPILPMEPIEPEKAVPAIFSASPVTKVYAGRFSKIGPELQKKYGRGEMPRLHKIFFDALLAEMGGEKRKQIKLHPILERLKISGSQTVAMLTCLEYYGYLAVERLPGKGRPLEFEVLREE